MRLYTLSQISGSCKKLQAMLHKVFGLFFIILISTTADCSERPLSRAFEAMQDENWDLALNLAGKEGKVAKDIVEWHMHRAQAGTARAALAFLKRNPDWPGLPYLKKRAERSFLNASMKVSALFFYENPPKTAEGALAYALTLRTGQQYEAARKVIRNAWLNYSMPVETQNIFISLYGEYLGDLTSQRLRKMLWRQNTAQVRSLYALLDKGELALARACLALQAGERGVDALIANIPQKFHGEPVLSHARFKWRLQSKKVKSALKLIQESSLSVKSLEWPSAWGKDRSDMARNLIFEKRYKEAYDLASRNHMTQGPVFTDLEWLSGFIALRYLNNAKLAQLHFETVLSAVDTPISLGRANYWLGRAYKALDMKDQARNAFMQGAKYQTSFYGLLSAEEVTASFPYDFSPLPKLPDWRNAPFRKSSVFQAAILLFASGKDVLGERFITHLAETLSDREIMQLTDFLEKSEKSHILITLGKRKASQGKSFPRPYFATHPLINEEYVAPKQLSLAIARRESEFDPNLVSPVGALGLMQVMPRTGKEMAAKIGVIYDSRKMLSDWKYNALIGTTYLQELSERFTSNPILVAIGYNAGPTRAENWSAVLGDPRREGLDIVDWIELIPFSETRNYVMRTTESIPIYRARLGLDPLPVPFTEFLKGSGF